MLWVYWVAFLRASSSPLEKRTSLLAFYYVSPTVANWHDWYVHSYTFCLIIYRSYFPYCNTWRFLSAAIACLREYIGLLFPHSFLQFNLKFILMLLKNCRKFMDLNSGRSGQTYLCNCTVNMNWTHVPYTKLRISFKYKTLLPSWWWSSIYFLWWVIFEGLIVFQCIKSKDCLLLLFIYWLEVVLYYARWTKWPIETSLTRIYFIVVKNCLDNRFR